MTVLNTSCITISVSRGESLRYCRSHSVVLQFKPYHRQGQHHAWLKGTHFCTISKRRRSSSRLTTGVPLLYWATYLYQRPLCSLWTRVDHHYHRCSWQCYCILQTGIDTCALKPKDKVSVFKGQSYLFNLITKQVSKPCHPLGVVHQLAGHHIIISSMWLSKRRHATVGSWWQILSQSLMSSIEASCTSRGSIKLWLYQLFQVINREFNHPVVQKQTTFWTFCMMLQTNNEVWCWCGR